ncbi:Mu transposase C-terminal domain-containing protein [Noviherbaspirillum sp. 1P10PC]|uniref:Mu transposase C-terminal domain-containing protein n=1 Tax=Noviherbaspirillum sp. 1P10PC TaxID=3132292 RepID=UPI0039A08F0B
MRKSQLCVQVGSKIRYDGEVHVVTGFAGAVMEMRDPRGRLNRRATVEVLTSESFGLLERIEGRDTNGPTFIDNVPAATLNAAQVLAAHVMEAITGYKSGTRADAKIDEPLPGFDPETTTLTERIRAKAAELNMAFRTLWAKKSRYEQYGLYGLIDRRVTRLATSMVDERVKEAIRTVIDSLENASNPTKMKIRRLVEKELKTAYPNEIIQLPSNTSFNRLLDSMPKGSELFGPAKRRRSIANRPDTPYSHFAATRPGEMLAIDSTPFDAFAMDPYSYEWVQIQLTIALDIFTRSVVAWRFTPVSTKGVDAALLLYDTVRPKAMQQDWPDSIAWSYCGVPESIVVEVGGDGKEESSPRLAAVPFLHPESVIVDRGRVFLSEAFSRACNDLGINLFVARPYTPTDKAHVERVFRTIRERFVENLAGYKGPDVYSRGLDVEKEAYWFIDEIESEFALWVATFWQPRHHDGLSLPHVPDLNISPNNMYEEGIARAGFVYVIPDQRLFYDLLPTKWVSIQHYGVELRRLRYDGDILNDFRGEKSPYLGEHAGKWPIRYDPRDRSTAFFYDPLLDKWHELKWTGHSGLLRPFNEKTISYAKAHILKNGGNPSNHAELEKALNELLNRIEDRQMEGGRERRIAAVNNMNAAAAARDRPRGNEAYEPDAESSLVGIDAPVATQRSTKPAKAGVFQVDEDALEAFPTVDEVDEDADDDLDI